MKTAAIIAEYNPFHNGHKYQIEETKRQTGANFIVVVMSGDFVQRGIPAMYSKTFRTRSALLSGADLVIEMPIFGTLSAAQDFARCGVSLFHHMGMIDVLSFGSESGNIEELWQLADHSALETNEQSALIREGLRSGLTYPQALTLAKKETVSRTTPIPTLLIPTALPTPPNTNRTTTKVPPSPHIPLHPNSFTCPLHQLNPPPHTSLCA